MLVRISGSKKDYAWGSTHLVQDHLGLGQREEKIAEIWFGTHPGGESLVQSSRSSESSPQSQNQDHTSEELKPLSELLGSKLSFLAKFLAAATPLSIQVHPNPSQALEGFEREQALGLSVSDPTRNYRDASHKPEILIALTGFSALCGFRPRAEILSVFSSFGESEPRFAQLAQSIASGISLRDLFSELLEDHDLAESFESSVPAAQSEPLAFEARALLSTLLANYPGDTGALVALMMNHVELEAGEAIFLPAGNLHAYLSGLGFEVMAASDNVIRGGLTVKHVDKTELLAITDFSELTQPVTVAKKLAHGLVAYPVAVTEFQVYRAEVSAWNLLADIDLPGEAMVICVSGEVAVGTSLEEREVIGAGAAVFVSGAKKISLSGSGQVFLVLGG